MNTISDREFTVSKTYVNMTQPKPVFHTCNQSIQFVFSFVGFHGFNDILSRTTIMMNIRNHEPKLSK